MNMSKEATKEYTIMMRKRYRVMKAKRAKGVVLDEFCQTTSVSRKRAIKVLGSQAEPLRQAA